MKRLPFLVVMCSLVFPTIAAGQATAEKETAESKITFEEHIKPIFREHCTTCHNNSDKESDLALDSYGAALSGGSSGEVIAAGDAGGSRLYALVAHAERPYMPPDQDPIPAPQLALVKTWIEQGMPENSGSKIKRINSAAAVMLNSTSAGKPAGPPPMPGSLLRQPVTETDRSAAISALAASPWAPLIAIGGQQQVCLYHAQTAELLGVIPFPEGEPQSLNFTRDGKQILIGGGRHAQSGCAVLVDIETGDRLAKVGDELDIVLAADITPDKQRIAVAGPQKVIRIYDSLSGELVVEMKKHTDWIFALRYSPDGVLLASADRSNGLVVWEANSGRLYADLVGHKGSVLSLDFRADSNVLASGSLDGTIKLWDMYESQPIKSWDAHPGGVTSVVFAQNGLIASAGRDSRIKLWNGNGELQREFQGLGETALEVALTGDAEQVAGGDWNGRAQVWRADDPSQTKLIATNPPTIETRLANALSALVNAQALYDAARQANDQALLARAEAKEGLELAQSQVDSAAEQAKTATIELAQLTASLGDYDLKIEQLEAQLLELRQLRQQSAARLQQVQAFQSEVSVRFDTAGRALQAALEANAKLAAEAERTQADAAELETKLAAAEQAKQQASADLAAFEARIRALDEHHQQARARIDELENQLASATAAEQSEAEDAKQLATQLKDMQRQLAEMQQRLEALLLAESQAKQQLEAKRQGTTRLQSEWEVAKQAAMDAEEKLKLFEQSYRRPE